MRHILIEAAHAAAKTKHTHLSALFHRLVSRRGKKKALVAVGHSILVIAYHVLTRHEPYRDMGENYIDERDRQEVGRRLVRRLDKLGYEVALMPTAQAA